MDGFWPNLHSYIVVTLTVFSRSHKAYKVLAQIYCCDMDWLDFCDHDPLFKVIQGLRILMNGLSAPSCHMFLRVSHRYMYFLWKEAFNKRLKPPSLLPPPPTPPYKKILKLLLHPLPSPHRPQHTHTHIREIIDTTYFNIMSVKLGRREMGVGAGGRGGGAYVFLWKLCSSLVQNTHNHRPMTPEEKIKTPMTDNTQTTKQRKAKPSVPSSPTMLDRIH